MESVFCPRCESELQGEPQVCPACGYDESVEGAPTAPVEDIPYSERYGTIASASPRRRSPFRISRTRLLVVFAILAIIVLYASLVTIRDMRARNGAFVVEPTHYGTLV